MTHKEEVKLNRLQMKLETEKEIVEKLLNGGGEWHDGEGKGRAVLRIFNDERLSATVSQDQCPSCLPRYFITVPGWKMKMGITDEDLTDILDEGVKKVKDAKLAAKQKADEERQKKSKVSNMDVFNRVAAFLKKNGYKISTPSNEQEPITMKLGSNLLKWNNLRDFVSADYEERGCWERDGYVSIFKAVSYWTRKYYKLAYPTLKRFVDKVKVLGEVDEQAKVPVAVMDELNRLKI